MPNLTNFTKTFLKSIEQTSTKGVNSAEDSKLVRTVYLSQPANHGKYQIFPMNSTVTGLPFVQLPKTREIKIPRTLRKSDGTEVTYDYWVKILPHSAFDEMDEMGRTTSGLTSSESQLLSSVQAAFDKLYAAMGGFEKEKSKNLTVGKLRKKNYTIFYAKCLQHWGLDNPRQAEETNYSALFVCAAKGFTEVLNDNIKDIIMENGGDESWLDQIYNRNLTGRTGYMTFNISLPQNIVGYKLTIDHKYNSQQFVNEVITPEEESLMQDPVERFLGWQVDKERHRNFNARVLEEVLTFINAELANYPESGNTNSGPSISPTNAFSAVGTQPTPKAGETPTHVDPFTGKEAGKDVGAPAWNNPGFAQNPWGNSNQ